MYVEKATVVVHVFISLVSDTNYGIGADCVLIPKELRVGLLTIKLAQVLSDS
jgi:hypothetical protein